MMRYIVNFIRRFIDFFCRITSMWSREMNSFIKSEYFFLKSGFLSNRRSNDLNLLSAWVRLSPQCISFLNGNFTLNLLLITFVVDWKKFSQLFSSSVKTDFLGTFSISQNRRRVSSIERWHWKASPTVSSCFPRTIHPKIVFRKKVPAKFPYVHFLLFLQIHQHQVSRRLAGNVENQGQPIYSVQEL